MLYGNIINIIIKIKIKKKQVLTGFKPVFHSKINDNPGFLALGHSAMIYFIYGVWKVTVNVSNFRLKTNFLK